VGCIFTLYVMKDMDMYRLGGPVFSGVEAIGTVKDSLLDNGHSNGWQWRDGRGRACPVHRPH